MKLLEQKIKSLLQEHLYIFEELLFKKDDFEYVQKRYKEDIENVLEDLDALEKVKYHPPTPEIITDKFILKIWTTLDFNRYRLKTLRADFYDELKWFKVDSYRVACRNHEKECLKKGILKDNWSLRDHEVIFGKSESAGDLGLNGSATWKMKAYQSFIQDLLLFHQRKPVIVLSIYDKIMVNGSLTTIEKLLLEKPTEFDKYFWQFLTRKVTQELFIQ